MKFLPLLLVVAFACLTACEPSGIAKEEMEKFSGTPTPTFAPIVTPTPVDPADIVQVDTSLDGDTLSVNGYQQSSRLKCDKYNNVRVNGDENVVTITGACRQVIVNGDKNQVTAEAAIEFAFNGTENKVTFSHFANGKRPAIIENLGGNEIAQVRVSLADNTANKTVK